MGAVWGLCGGCVGAVWGLCVGCVWAVCGLITTISHLKPVAFVWGSVRPSRNHHPQLKLRNVRREIWAQAKFAESVKVALMLELAISIEVVARDHAWHGPHAVARNRSLTQVFLSRVLCAATCVLQCRIYARVFGQDLCCFCFFAFVCLRLRTADAYAPGKRDFR